MRAAGAQHRPIRSRSAAIQAAISLLVLLAHLAFMASPLHARMLGDPAPPALTTERAVSFMGPLDDGDMADDCAITWAAAGQGLSLIVLLAYALTTIAGSVGGATARLRPVARALGPPSGGDPQALLQVFRL